MAIRNKPIAKKRATLNWLVKLKAKRTLHVYGAFYLKPNSAPTNCYTKESIFLVRMEREKLYKTMMALSMIVMALQRNDENPSQTARGPPESTYNEVRKSLPYPCDRRCHCISQKRMANISL